MATAVWRKDAKRAKPLPARNSDLYTIIEALSAKERLLVKQLRAFVETSVAPVVDKHWPDNAFSSELLPAL
jgi:hypothetical protein